MRSDTVTQPTKEMRLAAKEAIVGDDVFGDDPSVNELESYAAELLGKEAAIFVTSGTQGNLSAILSHTSNGDEILLEKDSHIYYYEVGGISAVGGTIPRLFDSDKGFNDHIGDYIRPSNVHFARTTLLCLENTHNRHGGIALTVDQIGQMARNAHDCDLKVHLDGARIFNATAYHQVDVKAYTREVDSIQICLSKGLSAPVGSIVAGDRDFIDEVRRKRKLLGGGMRQAGIIAAPGLIALRDMRSRLSMDHANADLLARGLSDLGVDVMFHQTNIILCDFSCKKLSSNEMVKKLADNLVLTVSMSEKLVRFTTHRHISKVDILNTIAIVEKILK